MVCGRELGMGNRESEKQWRGDPGVETESLFTIPDSPFPIPGYFGANRVAPSRRMVSPLR
ncbi:hypothetical protein [Lysobacter gummosus]|uniref:hypothetical protein n=1 Tax=Lysobacter gummosus TaxID=262324 RepID=UPI003631CCA6